MKKLVALLIAAMLAVTLFSFPVAVSAEGEDIVHYFGGESGEFETDADNSAGVWSYYGTPDTLANKRFNGLNAENADSDNPAYGFSEPEQGFRIEKGGFVHPSFGGEFLQPVVGLAMEATGRINITMQAHKQDSEEGDGVKVSFYRNNDLGLLGSQVVSTLEPVTLTLPETAVMEGDSVYFVVNNNGSPSFDGTILEITYTLTPDSTVTPPEEEEVITDISLVPDKTQNKRVYRFGYMDFMQGTLETDADNSSGVWSYFSTKNGLAEMSDESIIYNETADEISVSEEGSVGFTIRRNGFVSPDYVNGNMVVIGLRAEFEGKMRLFFSGIMDENNHGEGGNGFVYRFYKNDSSSEIGQIDMSAEKYMPDGTTVKRQNLLIDSIDVKAGDMIYIFQDCKGDFAFDGSNIYIRAQLVYDKTLEPAGENPCACTKDGACTHTEQNCICATDCTCEHCKEFAKEPLQGKTEMFNNLDDYRAIQGYKNFRYLYGKRDEGIAGFTEFPVNNTGSMWDTDNAIPFLGVRSDGMMCPGTVGDTFYNTAISWTAPRSMTVDVYADAILEDIDTNQGDGAIFRIYKNDTLLREFTFNKATFVDNDETPLSVQFNGIEVNEGDVFYFVVDAGGSFGWDSVLTYIEITAEKKEETTPPVDPGNGGENDPSGNDRLPPWAIALICVGGVLIIGGVVAVIVIRKRKK